MSGRAEIAGCSWPIDRLGEAIAALGARAGIATPDHEAPRAPAVATAAICEDRRVLGRWIEATADWLGLEAEPTSLPYGALADRLSECAPAIARLPSAGAPCFLALLRGSRGRVFLLTPDSEVRRIRSRDLAAILRDGNPKQDATNIDALVELLRLPSGRRMRVRDAIADERLRLEELEGIWLLRPHASSSFAKQIAHAGVWNKLAALAAAHTAEYLCWILAWRLVGLGAMQGRLDRGWLMAWVLLLATIVPLRVATTWLQGRIAIAGGAILKQRLLVGALRMDPDQVSREGAGHLLGRVMESEAFESLALSGGLVALVSVIELLLACGVLAFGAGRVLEIPLLVAWTAVVLWMGARYLARNRSWAALRLGLTHDLVERMLGHRTRVAQESPERWHEGEDNALDRYGTSSQAMDRGATWLTAAAGRGWLLIALAAFGPWFVAGSSTPTRLAITIGGVLLAYRALRRLSTGLSHLAEAGVAWQQVAPLFYAGAHRDPPGAPDFVVESGREQAGDVLLQSHDLTFRHATRPDPVLKGVSLALRRGDRLLLEGESGSGKSTFASILAALRSPDSGLLLAGGLDRRTLGAEGWRRRVAAAPQFNDNHVINGTFAFNLLMSRPSWPPTEQDIALIEPLCQELGLDGLLARMPGGIRQMVGESGWQLSHGERSRLFLARALLQDASLVVLDESFAALDPENLRRAAECARRRAPALLVIAHP